MRTATGREVWLDGSGGGGAAPAAISLRTAAKQAQAPTASSHLKLRLVCGDIAAVLAAWTLTAALAPTAAPRLWAVAGVLATLLALRSYKLYSAPVASVRSVELQGMIRSAGIGAVAAYVAVPGASFHTTLPIVASAAALTLGLLVIHRSLYRSWLNSRRRAGLSVRPVVLVGDNAEAADLDLLVEEHAELGLRISATVVPGMTGDLGDNVRHAVAATGATGVLIAATSMRHEQINTLVRVLLDAGVHVHLSSGLRGISHSRVQSVSMAHEPLLYLQPASLSPLQKSAKRALDLVVSGLMVLVGLPVFAALAIAIKIEDGGPVFFKQQRVGRNGELFNVNKLRTMVVDAEARLAALKANNQRGDGPLFKMASDPRITRIGRVLRATSLDELPQLFNVLEGTMSLVGPRPALPAEMAAFDDQLQNRVNVTPGITGLWQAEARDNPAFRPYRRLDLFYVENWSLGLDISILLTTFFAVAGRALQALRPATGARLAAVLD